MKRKRFSEEQIIKILGLHQAGAKPADLCRQHGISEATLYNWQTRYGGLQVSEAKRLRSLELPLGASVQCQRKVTRDRPD
jgi:putative transposase